MLNFLIIHNRPHESKFCMPISVKICTFLIFAGINLRFLTENILNALVFFNILQSGDPGLRFDIHAPSLPDIYGDVITVLVFSAAYFLTPPGFVKRTVTRLPDSLNDNLGELHLAVVKQLTNHLKKKGVAPFISHIHKESIRLIKRYTCRTKDIFMIVSAGFGLYLFSKYILSVGLEVLTIENEKIRFILNSLNDVIKLCSSLVFVYIYCTYLSTNRGVNFTFYGFFFIRNFFSTNAIGLFTEYDLHVIAPFLDLLTPIIIIYTTFYFFSNYRKTLLFKIVGIKNS